MSPSRLRIDTAPASLAALNASADVTAVTVVRAARRAAGAAGYPALQDFT